MLAPGMAPRDFTDITGDGAVHTLASLTGIRQCRWFSLQAVSVASTPARVGSANISTSRGGVIGAGGSFFMPIQNGGEMYDLTLWNVLVASSDTVAFLCDQV